MIVGDKELGIKLEQLAKIDILKAVKSGISFVQEAAKALCPVNDGELRNSIYTMTEEKEGSITGICYTNKEYAPYVELGAGPRGQKNHAGISPNVEVSYSQSPWWIHESQIDKETAERYHFFSIETEKGTFYQCTGQPARPFLYPALKNNEEEVLKIMVDYLKKD